MICKSLGQGQLFIISAPSGAGKTTLISILLKEFNNIKFSISYTTRLPRKNEVDGINYHFIDKDKFQNMIDKNEFLEWAQVHNNFYGTSKNTINKMLKNGTDVILDIDPQGALQIKEIINFGVYIFICPPSLSQLKARLLKRCTDDIQSINTRIKNAKNEVNCIKNYNYLIINNNIDKAFEELKAIYIAEKLKTTLINDISDIIELDYI